VSPTAEIAALYALVASVVAVVLVAALHRLEPEFDPRWRMLSEYSLGRYGYLMRIAFVAAASAVIEVALALRSITGATVPLLLVLVAIGPLGAAFVDTDPINIPPDQRSTRDTVHTALAALFILGFPPAASAVGIALSGEPAIGGILAWTSLIAWAGLAVFVTSIVRYMRPGAMAGPNVRIGWPNRVNMLAYMVWVAVAAITVLR
jgi:hypothetical protein